ncbi:MAG: energy-coupled thiamine transporter ThiT [Eubacterium sp.]|nr:energy-coupled thiamine transporter ThiT [Eubacterium sp.]
MSLFVAMTEDGYALTTAGYILTAILFVAVIVIAAMLAKKGSAKKMNAKQLAYCGMIIALGTITSMIKLYEFPFGGSVTCFSMLFVCLAGYFFGPATGILTGAAYGILQFLLGPYILFPIQVIVDYLLAFAALGLSDIFWKSKQGLIKGYLLGIFGRYIFAVLSGWLFFGEYAWEGWNPLPYSLAYNAAYIFVEGAATLIILAIPAVSKGLEQIKRTAMQ